MFNNPVTTTICKDDDGTVCCPGDTSEELKVYIEESTTTEPTGIGSKFSPYKIDVKISEEEGNMISVESDGLFVPPPDAPPDIPIMDADNGLSIDAENKTVEFGGTLTKNTTIFGNGSDFVFEGGGPIGSRFSIRTRPLDTNAYQAIGVDGSNWAYITNVTPTLTNGISVGSTFLELVSLENADGIIMRLTKTGIQYVHGTNTLPSNIAKLFLDGRMQGAQAINDDEFITKAQMDNTLAVFTDDFFNL